MVVLQLQPLSSRFQHCASLQNKSYYKVRVSNSYSRPSGNSRIVTMVDPLEAKRLAVKEMEQIIYRAKLERRRQIEAINGGWAMLGLTAGLVIEAHTGKSIPDQIMGYLAFPLGILSQYMAQLRELIPLDFRMYH